MSAEPQIVLWQNFTMELRKASSHSLALNVTSETQPSFLARGLEPNSAYIVSIFAENEKGRSERVNLHVFTTTANSVGNNNNNINKLGKNSDGLFETNESALTNSSEFGPSSTMVNAIFITGKPSRKKVNSFCLYLTWLSKGVPWWPSLPSSSPCCVFVANYYIECPTLGFLPCPRQCQQRPKQLLTCCPRRPALQVYQNYGFFHLHWPDFHWPLDTPTTVSQDFAPQHMLGHEYHPDEDLTESDMEQQHSDYFSQYLPSNGTGPIRITTNPTSNFDNIDLPRPVVLDTTQTSLRMLHSTRESKV